MDDDVYEIRADGQLRERLDRFASADARAEVMSGMEPEVAFAVHGPPTAEGATEPSGPEQVLARYEVGRSVPLG